jgi:hypothetical protein
MATSVGSSGCDNDHHAPAQGMRYVERRFFIKNVKIAKSYELSPFNHRECAGMPFNSRCKRSHFKIRGGIVTTLG